METIGRYQVRRLLGVGGFGKVWEAWDPHLKRRVAVKTCSEEDRDVRRRFLLEAEIAASLDHPNIVHIYDFGTEGEVPYLVEEFCEGEDLSTLLERTPQVLTLEQKLTILAQVARGLEHAHSRGVVHRDVKPGNIRVLPDLRAKLLDFGMARLAESAMRLTRAGTTVGTAAYMSPEQVEGLPVGPSADLFSFGVTAYELLTGIRPFEGESLSRVFYRILHEHPAPLLEVDPHLPKRLSRLIERCLAKRPEDRPASAAEVATVLEAILGLRTDPAFYPAFPTGSFPARSAERSLTRDARTEKSPLLAEGRRPEASDDPRTGTGAPVPGKFPTWFRWGFWSGALLLGIAGIGLLWFRSVRSEAPNLIADSPKGARETASVPKGEAPAQKEAALREHPGAPQPASPTVSETAAPVGMEQPPVAPVGTVASPRSPNPAVAPARGSGRSPATELLERAEQRFDRGEWVEAQRLLGEFLKRFPTDPDAPYASRLLARVEDRLQPSSAAPAREASDEPRALSDRALADGLSGGLEPAPPFNRSGEEALAPGIEHPSGVRFLRVPAGEGWVGCVPEDPECGSQESPGRLVRLERSFFLAETETTVGQYRQFAQASGTPMPPSPGFTQDDRHPVVNVSWWEARRFCFWVGGRLPTETEWEYAARWGIGRARFPWAEGAVWERANASGIAGQDTYRFTAPVGSFPPNPLGLYDLAGNVWEWVEDVDLPAPLEKGGNDGRLQPVKGGSWFNDLRALRVSARERFAPEGASAHVGFRCARDETK